MDAASPQSIQLGLLDEEALHLLRHVEQAGLGGLNPESLCPPWIIHPSPLAPHPPGTAGWQEPNGSAWDWAIPHRADSVQSVPLQSLQSLPVAPWATCSSNFRYPPVEPLSSR